MKNYQMATVLNPAIVKQPFKVIEIPLGKFSGEVIPHHQNNFESYKSTIHKLISINNADQLKKETKDKRTVRQLRDLMYELDTLRTQVEDKDLDKFDSKTLPLRKILINLVRGYSELEKAANQVINANQNPTEATNENHHQFEGAPQIQILEDIKELKLIQQQEQLSHVESIQRDVEDLHEMYQNLNEMVVVQGDNVEQVGNNVAETQQNIESGAQHLRTAHKLKAVAYPVTGAFLGGMIGGPIGLVAGMKVGGIAALGCAIVGYTGGRWVKKQNDNVGCEVSDLNPEETDGEGTSPKKKI